MKFWKRLAAGLLAGVMAVSAAISAGASRKGNYFHVYRYETLEDGSYIHVSGESLGYYGDIETIKTLTDLGTIENFGDPEKEIPVLIPASQIENYPVGTIVSYSVSPIANGGYPVAYVTDGNRSNFQSTCGVDDEKSRFIITKEMKESGVLFTGYEVNKNSTTGHEPATILSVKLSGAVAAKYEFKSNIPSIFQTISPNEFWDKYESVSWDELDEYEKVFISYGSSDIPNSNAVVITPGELSDIPVGANLEIIIGTTKVVEIGDTYTFRPRVQFPLYDEERDEISRGIESYRQELTLLSAGDLTGLVSIYLSEEMKTYGFAVIISSDEYIEVGGYYVPSESSEIDPVDPTDPTVKPGFSTPAGETSVKEVPVGTVVTQKTAAADGRCGERFIKKVSASDVVNKTKATFTLSNGTVTKTVSTTQYHTALTVDGETVSAGEGYVFLVYTLSGIPEDVTITVGDVILE